VPRYRLTIEYAGTKYSGWQRQKNARTVQGELDRAIRQVTSRDDFELYGAGRTDAGVHASGQVAHLDVAQSVTPASLRDRLNDELPSDINVLAVEKVSHTFHARHSAVGRRYVYQIARRRTAFAKHFVWWVREPIDVEAMQLAARGFVGMRDFESFAQRDVADKASGKARSTLVLIERLDVLEFDDLLLVVVEGSHFLWKMVRRIVGVLVEVGRGALSPGEAGALLATPSERPARLTAPASGLFLERVSYEGDRVDTSVQPPTPISARETRAR
jgi:tRNA pseudouridine38-40 synthase